MFCPYHSEFIWPSRHTVFGEIAEGLDVIKEVESYGTQGGRPRAKIMIESCGAVEK